MRPPTESELDKLQSRIDMCEDATEALLLYRDAKQIGSPRMAASILAYHVIKLLDEIEELETTIATQACDIVEYKRERALTRSK